MERTLSYLFKGFWCWLCHPIAAWSWLGSFNFWISVSKWHGWREHWFSPILNCCVYTFSKKIFVQSLPVIKGKIGMYIFAYICTHSREEMVKTHNSFSGNGHLYRAILCSVSFQKLRIISFMCIFIWTLCQGLFPCWSTKLHSVALATQLPPDCRTAQGFGAAYTIHYSVLKCYSHYWVHYFHY